MSASAGRSRQALSRGHGSGSARLPPARSAAGSPLGAAGHQRRVHLIAVPGFELNHDAPGKTRAGSRQEMHEPACRAQSYRVPPVERRFSCRAQLRRRASMPAWAAPTARGHDCRVCGCGLGPPGSGHRSDDPPLSQQGQHQACDGAGDHDGHQGLNPG